jgi:hypothetical protein
LDEVRQSHTNIITLLFHCTESGGGLSEIDHAGIPTEEVFLHFSRSKETQARSYKARSLDKRGWTLQEDILAVRTIHYGFNQLHWECQRDRMAEGMRGVVGGSVASNSVLKRLFLSNLTNNVTDGSWYRIVEEYMPRELTRPEDMFPAISSIAREVHRQTGFTYRAGIWLEDFHRGLLWTFCGESERCGSYVAPTWSWGSIRTIRNPKQHTHYRPQAGENLSVIPDVKAKLLGCNVTPRGDDTFGQITHAAITLRGLWLWLSEWKSTDGILFGTSRFGDRPKSPWSIKCNFDEELAHPDWCSGRDFLITPGSDIL